jgi:hypothetical protein
MSHHDAMFPCWMHFRISYILYRRGLSLDLGRMARMCQHQSRPALVGFERAVQWQALANTGVAGKCVTGLRILAPHILWKCFVKVRFSQCLVGTNWGNDKGGVSRHKARQHGLQTDRGGAGQCLHMRAFLNCMMSWCQIRCNA